MKMTLKNHWLLLIAGLGAFMVMYLLYTVPWDQRGTASVGPKLLPTRAQSRQRSQHYDMWPMFQATENAAVDQAWFQKTCLPVDMEVSIENLSRVLSLWVASTDSRCRDLLSKFHSIFQVSMRNASLLMPKTFEDKVRKWLNNDESLVHGVYNQEIIHVANKFTREQTIFNPLRDKRPFYPPEKPEGEYLEELLQKTSQSCDFCNYKNYTAEHVFHRVENAYAFSASNTFKMDTLHALFALKQHNPIQWSPDMFMGLMELSLTWFLKAHKSFPSARFPSMIWDVLPKCGASQVHPHLHGFLDPERYPGVTEAWRQGAQEYFSMSGSNFFTDMAKQAAILGLATSHGSAIAYASLVPRKDHEIVVMAPTANRDFFEMLFFVLRAIIDDIGRYCFSLGMAYPSLEGLEGVMPAYARVITRGMLTDTRSDIGSLELFTATNVNIDPFKVAKQIQASVEKRRSTFSQSLRPNRK